MRRCCTTAENIYQSCGKQLFTGVTGVCSEAAQTPLTPAKSCCNRTNCPGQQILGREKSQQPSLSVFVFSKGEKLSFYKPALVGSDQLFPENTIINRRAKQTTAEMDRLPFRADLSQICFGISFNLPSSPAPLCF